MTRPLALLSALMLSGCSANGAPPMVPDQIAHWHDNCDWSQLVGKVARVEWHTPEKARERCNGSASAFAESTGGKSQSCIWWRPEDPVKAKPWGDVNATIIAIPTRWAEDHEKCHLALGPSSRNHPPHHGGKQ